MTIYIVTLFNPSGLREDIIKVFSTKDNLDRWLECARQMDREIFGDQGRDITQNYRIKETQLDNLDFVSLLAEARGLGAQVKPSQPQ
jgi:hypothetical protein